MKVYSEVTAIQKFTIITEFGNSSSVNHIVERFNISYQQLYDIIREFIREPYIILESKINYEKEEE